MVHREAVLHIPLSEYAYASSETLLTIRLRAAKGNLSGCTLFYADRAYPHADPIPFTPIEMRVIASDGLFDYFDVTFTPGLTRVCYYFRLACPDEEVIYCSNLFVNTPPTVRSEYYQYPFIRREEISQIPEWFKNAVVYNIFPDSFASGKGTLSRDGCSVTLPGGVELRTLLGGTLNGITENLDYIKSMGFNCLYLNPIFTASDYHKYDLVDYFHIDPCFGTDADFGRLVDAAHSVGMRVIIDGVFNHCGKHFFAFEDVQKNGRSSKYWDWFYGLEEPVVVPGSGQGLPEYHCFAYEPKMPKLNTSNPETRDYFMEVCRHWTETYHVDGWRLDVANEVDKEFWRAFRRTAKGINPECVLIAEIWESAETWLRGDMFDSTMNYEFRKHCRDFFAEGSIDSAEFDARATMLRMRYPKGIVQGQLNLLDSHDVSRFLSLCGGDIRCLKLAVLFLAIFPGVPSVFYGDEHALQGIEEIEYRQAMPWNDRNTELMEFYTLAMGLRKNPAAIQGNYRVLSACKGEMVYIVERKTNEHSLVVLLNAGDTPACLAQSVPPVDPMLSHGWKPEMIDGFGYAVWSK